MIISDNYTKLYTTSRQALQTIYILKKYVHNLKNCTIVDANAGIGGNAIYFCKYCKFVYCLDISIEATHYLEHNLKEFNNKLIINDNCLDIIKIIQYDILYFDPPWGGSEYKYKKNVNLYLSEININKIIENLYFSCNIILLKAPINFNQSNKSLWNINSHNIYKNDNKTVSFKLIVYYKFVIK